MSAILNYSNTARLLAWRYGIYATLLLALALQLHALGARTLHGDELNSIHESVPLGLNANSLPYFALLRVWLAFGDGEFWLRSLSALAVVVAVALTFVWVNPIFGKPVALLAAVLLATSPFLIH